MILFLRVTLAAVSMLLFGQASGALYVSTDTMLKSDSGSALGTVTPGTQVAVSANSDGNAQVQIDGWQPKGESTVLFDGVDSQIALVRLSKGAPSPVVTGTKTDPYGTVWSEVRISGVVSSGALTPDISTVWTAGAKLFGNRCSTCHTLHQPTEFTANQWPGVVGSMAHNAALSAAEQDLVIRYLQANARPAQ